MGLCLSRILGWQYVCAGLRPARLHAWVGHAQPEEEDGGQPQHGCQHKRWAIAEVVGQPAAQDGREGGEGRVAE